MERTIVGCIAALTLNLLACSSDDDGGGSAGNGSTSGIPPTKQINQLTDEEARQLCEGNADRFAGISTAGCRFAIVTISMDQAACETAVAECSSPMDGGTGIDCSATDVSDVANCAATVGELESCLDQLQGYYESVTCADVGMQPAAPPACAESIATCFGSAAAGGE